MSHNNNTTPSPKHNKRFISTIRRTFIPTSPNNTRQKTSWSNLFNPRGSHSSSPTSSHLSTPPPTNQPSPQQRRYAAVFSKISFSTPEFIEDRYIYSSHNHHLLHHTDHHPQLSLLTQEDLIPNRSFFSIPSTRQPSIIHQNSSTSNLTQLTLDSHLPPSNSPLRSCFQEVFDLIDAGLAAQDYQLITPIASSDDHSLDLTHSDNSLEESDQSFGLTTQTTSDEPVLDLNSARTSEEESCIGTSSCWEEETIESSTTTTQVDLLPLTTISDLLGGLDNHSQEHHHIPLKTYPHLTQPEQTSRDHSIQDFLHSLSLSLRSDPTEFSPQISEWDQESTNQFSWLHSDHSTYLDQPEPVPQLSNPGSTEPLNPLSSSILKRSTARVKKLSHKPLLS